MGEDQEVRVYIFAGGQNERWKGIGPKEMALVDDEPVVYRTIRQCFQRKLKPIVVTHKPDIIRYDSEVTGFTKFVTVQFPTLSHACLSMDWGNRCLFLLGDVYYTDNAWDIIAAAPRLAFGNEVEIFAFRFSDAIHERLWDAFWRSIKFWEEGKGRGKLWETYRAYENWDLDDVGRLGKEFALIEDETTDFDTVGEYKAFMNLREKDENN